MSDEQWKNGGDCRKCRRLKYCGSDCTEHKRRFKRKLGEMVEKAMMDTFIKQVTEK